ncbi:2-hydroxychromene-2-carboxylate isomerase [Palleronia marisminoris]|uniref:2-hydroxychromene-2-carboxylate isomerase n=1 Tax=Palleronia marisminoris TaxID=315423 RepID=A0A1Y5S1T7_9RHOB|nr:2-hydroxychromene-2-carboxylate isomerase [Palleronia marisminoris]SFG41591.1 2-hydroxychromene-2-carboxylate isomerase [Palleronia marisminoris]SLN27995.1 2-hydroxychromene-2-carboxylate isomerase [Palleronia marisminoris]
MARIDYYFAPTSPFTYLAGTRLEGIAARHDAEIRYKPLDVIQLFARTGGVPPKDRHPNRQAYRLQDLARTAAMQDMPINLSPAHWPTNPAPSSFAIIAAQKAGGGDLGALVHGLCRACWAEEKNIAEDDVIADCLEVAGFDRGLANSGMLSGADTYARNLDEAVLAGAFGAPFYITEDDQRFWGQDRLAHLDWHLGNRNA